MYSVTKVRKSSIGVMRYWTKKAHYVEVPRRSGPFRQQRLNRMPQPLLDRFSSKGQGIQQ